MHYTTIVQSRLDSTRLPGIRAGFASLVLAPMEGVTDAPMRALMSERGGFTHCVSEFLRISQDVPPARVFLDHMPELRQNSLTSSGLPVQLQLLGGDPEKLATAAARAVQAGAWGIDLNFGCPAPTVNRHDGGATLLKYPARIRAIVEAVRRAVPGEVPVSAKIRLGWDSIEPVLENAESAAAGGASWITIHARTRMQSYQPPVFWAKIGEVRRHLAGIPIVANGDIWTIEDFRRCRDITGCEHFMIGRGALADPTLPLKIAADLGLRGACEEDTAPDWRVSQTWIPLLRRFEELYPARQYIGARMKQWVRMAHQRNPLPWFDEFKRAESVPQMLALLGDAGPAS